MGAVTARAGYASRMAPLIFAVLAGLFWGIGELCAKSVLKSHQVGPLTAIAVRTTVALPLLWLAYFAATRSWLEPLGIRAAGEPSTWPHADPPVMLKLILGAGVCAGALALACFYMGLSVGDISKVKPIAFCIAPAVAVLGGWLLLGEAMSVQKAVAVAMILGGVVLLTTSK